MTDPANSDAALVRYIGRDEDGTPMFEGPAGPIPEAERDAAIAAYNKTLSGQADNLRRALADLWNAIVTALPGWMKR